MSVDCSLFLHKFFLPVIPFFPQKSMNFFLHYYFSLNGLRIALCTIISATVSNQLVPKREDTDDAGY
jgi:hypothetical protein